MIIGIAGYKGSGKDTAGSVLVEKYGWDKMSFAKPIKELVGNTFKLDLEMLEGTTPANRELREQMLPGVFNYTSRELLQIIGTGLRDIVHQDVWVNIVLERYKRQDNHIVITDVRFPNEVKMINDNGFVIGIKRPGFNGDSHISERALDDIALPYVLNNTGNMEDLKANMTRFLEHKITK